VREKYSFAASRFRLLGPSADLLSLRSPDLPIPRFSQEVSCACRVFLRLGEIELVDCIHAFGSVFVKVLRHAIDDLLH
jgi:hypothetical protein